MQKLRTIGLDVAKNVFQVHRVEADGRIAVRRQLRRSDLHRFFSRLPVFTITRVAEIDDLRDIGQAPPLLKQTR